MRSGQRRAAVLAAMAQLMRSSSNADREGIPNVRWSSGSERPHAMKDTAGAIKLIGRASNLSVPHSAKLPVPFTTAAGSTIRQAEALVEPLIRLAARGGRL